MFSPNSFLLSQISLPSSQQPSSSSAPSPGRSEQPSDLNPVARPPENGQVAVNPDPSQEDNEVDDLLEDEIIEDDEEEADPSGFVVHSVLAPPIARQVTTRELHEMIHQGDIDLNPPYQRDDVWSVDKREKLIMSIYQNYWIPPIVLAVTKDEEGFEVRTCVDGKQRLTSIQKFMDGAIAYKVNKKAFYYTMPKSLKGKRLEVPPKYKDIFAAKTLTCVEYRGITSATERDIFQRVQLGVSLTAAEKLAAIDSPWADWMGILQAQFVEAHDGLRRVLEWNTKRGADFQCLAQLVFCCDTLSERANPSAQRLERWLMRQDRPTREFKEDVTDALNELLYIAGAKGLNDAFTLIPQRVAPVEFVFIGVMLYVMRAQTRQDRAKAILNMRLIVRKEHKDIRFNSVVAETLWDCVCDQDDQDVIPPRKAPRKRRVQDPTKTPKKRRNESEDDDDDMSGSYMPMKRLR